MPAIKLGLSNVVVMYALLFLRTRTALLLVVLKALFAFLTRGATAGFLSLCGGGLSLVVMLVLLHQKNLYIFPAYLCAAATRYMIDWLYMCLGAGGLLLAISGIVAFARKGKNCKG